LGEGRLDSQKHRCSFGQCFVVREPHYSNTAGFKVAGTSFIISLLTRPRMVLAIELDSEARFRTEEVQNVTTDRVLPPELESAELPRPQFLPEPSLGVGLLAA